MAREYFCAYHSFLKSIEPLNAAERGRLFTACLEYSMTGAEPELRGNERYIFPMIREQIDRDAKKYDARCEQNRNNILRRYTAEYDRIRTSTNMGFPGSHLPTGKEPLAVMVLHKLLS
jgi:hypothetical protein